MDFDASQIRERARAYAEDDLVAEVRCSLVTNAPIRKKFRKQMWKILTGEEWTQDAERIDQGRCRRCGSCVHFVGGERGSKTPVCDIGEDWKSCNSHKRAETF